MKKLFVTSVLILLALLAVAEARVGMAVSPAGGNWEFSRQGGTLQLAFHNLGDQDINVKFSVEQEGAKFVTLDKKEASIKANDFETVILTIRPDSSIEFGKPYPVLVYALPTFTASTQGTAVALSQGIGSSFKINFAATGSAPVIYQTTDVEKTKAMQKKAMPEFFLPLIVGVATALILLSVFFYIRKRKEEEEDVIVGPKR